MESPWKLLRCDFWGWPHLNGNCKEPQRTLNLTVLLLLMTIWYTLVNISSRFLCCCWRLSKFYQFNLWLLDWILFPVNTFYFYLITTIISLIQWKSGEFFVTHGVHTKVISLWFLGGSYLNGNCEETKWIFTKESYHWLAQPKNLEEPKWVVPEESYHWLDEPKFFEDALTQFMQITKTTIQSQEETMKNM